jgi:hypothetical protein
LCPPTSKLRNVIKGTAIDERWELACAIHQSALSKTPKLTSAVNRLPEKVRWRALDTAAGSAKHRKV